MCVKTWIFASQRYPFYLKKGSTKLVLMGEIDIYLSPDLYNNNNFFKKTLTKPAKLQLIQIC